MKGFCGFWNNQQIPTQNYAGLGLVKADALTKYKEYFKITIQRDHCSSGQNKVNPVGVEMCREIKIQI